MQQDDPIMQVLGLIWKNLEWKDKNLHTLNFLIISGVIQCYILSFILLFSKGGNIKANRFLAVALLIFSFHISYVMLVDINIDIHVPEFAYFPFFCLLGLGPSIYFYIKTITDVSFQFGKKEFLYYIPMLIEMIIQITYAFLTIGLELFGYFNEYFILFMGLDWLLGVISIFYFLNKTLKIIQSHENWILDHYSSLKNITLKWLQKLMILYKRLWILFAVYILFISIFFIFQLHYVIIYFGLYILLISFTYFTYYLGLQGYKNSESLIYIEKKKENAIEKSSKNFANLKEIEIDNHCEKLISLMEKDRLYLDEKLNLNKLAHHLNITPNLLSYLLNNKLNKRFHGFVNEYRITEVKNRLLNPAYNHLTILAIAYDSGFSSKASFNRIFKEATNMTPKQFLDTNKRIS